MQTSAQHSNRQQLLPAPRWNLSQQLQCSVPHCTEDDIRDIEIINLYRSPECRNIETFVKNLIDPGKKTIVVGDTNINYKDQKKQRFVEMMTEELGFEQLVTQPTFDRLPATLSPSLLDHVYVSSELRRNIKIEQKCVYYSDHDVILISLLCSSNSAECSVEEMPV